MSISSQPRAGPRRLPNRIHSDDSAIGLAVSSPREQALPPLPIKEYTYQQNVGFPTVPNDPRPGALRPIWNERVSKAPKSKTQKWRSIGGLFGKKTNMAYEDQYEPIDVIEKPIFYSPPKSKFSTNVTVVPPPSTQQSTKNEVVLRDQDEYVAGSNRIAAGPGVFRRASSRRKGLRKRSNTEDLRPTRPRAMTAPSVAGNVSTDDPARSNITTFQARPQTQRTVNSNLLQVEIPNVEMERYSVMFRDLLKPPPPQTLPSIQDSEWYRSVTEPAAAKKHAGAAEPIIPPSARKGSGSSTSSKTPSFSLFPPQPASHTRTMGSKAPPKPSPLGRSITAPDVTLTEPRPSITTSRSHEPSHLMILLHEQELSPAGIEHPSTLNDERVLHDLRAFNFRHSHSISSLSNPVSGSHPSSISSIRELSSAFSDPSYGQSMQSADVGIGDQDERPANAQTLDAVRARAEGFPTRTSSLKKSEPSRSTKNPRSKSPKRRAKGFPRRNSPPPTPPPKNSPARVPSPALPPLPALPLPPPIHTPSSRQARPSSKGQPVQDSKTSSVTSLVGASASGSDAEGHVVEIARSVSLSRREKKEVVLPNPSPPSAKTSKTSGPEQPSNQPVNPASVPAHDRRNKRERNDHSTSPEPPQGKNVGLGLDFGQGLEFLKPPQLEVESQRVDAARRVHMVRGWQERVSRADGGDLAGRKSEYVHLEEC